MAVRSVTLHRRVLAALAVSLYRFLLLAYPRPFRRRFGPEMIRALRLRIIDRRRDLRSALGFLIAAVADGLRTARLERRDRQYEERRWEAGAAAGPFGRLAGEPSVAREGEAGVSTGEGTGGGDSDGWGGPGRPLDELRQDLRHSLCLLRQRPGFTAATVLTLALGIGANATIFTLVNGMLLRPLPYEDAGRLINVREATVGSDGRLSVSYLNYLDWRRSQQVFEEMALYWSAALNLAHGENPVQVSGTYTDVTLLDVLGVDPILGRGFRPEENRPGSDLVVLLSHSLWQRHFQGDPGAVGRTIRLHSRPHTIVGVMPEGFHFREYAELWVPHQLEAEELGRANHSFDVVARLRAGVTLDGAAAEMRGIAARLAREHPETNASKTVSLERLREQLAGGPESPLPLLLGTVLFVLLLAVANVAGLMISHASSREQEIAIRSALGAGRGRLVRQLLVESLLLASMGGALGLLLGRWGRDALLGAIPIELPYWIDFSMDLRVVGFIAGVSAGAGVLLGLLPALSAIRPDLAAALRQGSGGSAGGAGRQRLRGTLVVAEIALAVLLLVGAGLMLRGMLAARASPPGFDVDDLISFRISLPRADYAEDRQVLSFYDRLLERVRGLPGVEELALGTSLPGEPSYWTSSVEAEGVDRSLAAAQRVVAPGFFRALGMPLLRGRAFQQDDGRDGPGVVIINRTLAERMFGTSDVVGRRVRYWSPDDDNRWLTVVGVLADVRESGPYEPVPPSWYLPVSQSARAGMNLAVRSDRDMEAVVGAVRDLVAELDPNLPVFSVKTMDRILAESGWENRVLTWIFLAFAGFALTLAGVGVYGVVAYAVGQRLREFGIRMALGARRRDVLGLVLRRGVFLTLLGLGLGIAGALALSGALSSVLFEVSPTDPLVYAAVGTVLGGLALLATWVPARRATRVDPVSTLRSE